VYAEQAPKQNNSLPVNQRGEIYAYSALTVLFGSAVVADIVEVASGGLSPAEGVARALTSVYATGWAGYGAARAHRETQAYHHAPGDKFYTPETISRRSFARNMRTIAWGGAVVCFGEVGIIEAVKLVSEGGSAKEVMSRLAMGAATTVGAAISGRGFLNSWRKRRELKHLADVFAQEQAKQLTDS